MAYGLVAFVPRLFSGAFNRTLYSILHCGVLSHHTVRWSGFMMDSRGAERGLRTSDIDQH